MSEVIRKAMPLRAEPGAGRTVRFTISTGDVDRVGDTIAPSGWRLEEWKQNPVILFGHRHDVPAIARGLSIGLVGTALKSTAEFPPEGLYPLADAVFGLVNSRFLTSASVGFRPEKWIYNDRGGVDFLEQTLLEWSVVNVPALPQAQIEGARAAAGAVKRWLGQADPVARAGLGRDGVGAGELVLELADDLDWRTQGEVVLELVDDRDEDVLILDVGGRPERLTRADLEAIVTQRLKEMVNEAVTAAVAEAVRRRRGR